MCIHGDPPKTSRRKYPLPCFPGGRLHCEEQGTEPSKKCEYLNIFSLNGNLDVILSLEIPESPY